ncbi:MAG: BrnA antitoxin family protein [Actinomycetota bacterium]|nr:BrnA antitoxin family protein [Actinomycetota bacterium]
MTSSPKQIPDFKSESEEREFWASHEVTELVPEEQWKPSRARRRQTTTFAIRLDHADVEKIRELALARGIGPTQLARSWLLDRLRLEQTVGELANPDADEEEVQIRRKVMDDLTEGIPPIVLGALAAFGIGVAVGDSVSKKKRADGRAEARRTASQRSTSKAPGAERSSANG